MLSARVLESLRQPIEQAIGLPGSTYSDPSFLALELKQVFDRNWVSVGFGYQVKGPGQVLPVTIGGQALLMVRDMSGTLRVFHNVCRHRGLQLAIGTDTKPVSAITCPYHGWTYGLDGQCISAPYWHRNERRAFRPKYEGGYGLLEVRTHVWLDTVFVNLSGNAPPFEKLVAPIANKWHTSEIAPLTHVTTWEHAIPANWKLVIENFLDSYHSPYVHPQLGGVEAHSAHGRLNPSRNIIGQRSINAAVNKPRSGPIPTIPQLEKALGNDDESYCLFPNTLLFAQRSFFSVRAIIPREVGLTYKMNAVYVSEAAAAEQFENERKRMKEVVYTVNNQDMAVLGRLQTTRSSQAADHCRFAPDWDFMCHDFQLRLAEELQA